ncbi:YKOF-related family protein [Sarocladium implicatum]|nr:YKOF-related family protein [Sarocladium implicatum]
MFPGAQISLYPMADDFVSIILGSLSALDPYRERFRIETDDISTLLVGPSDEIFPAMRDLHVAASRNNVHCVLHATISRGCPGDTDNPSCAPIAGRDTGTPLQERIEHALASVASAPVLGQVVAAQFSLYPLGSGHHMDEIYGCIDFLKRSGCFGKAKNYCTTLRGDAGLVFATLSEAFLRFGAPAGHLAIDLTVSANSPSKVTA